MNPLPRNLLNLTLVLSLALSLVAADSSFQHVHRRDHRMIKARAVVDPLPGNKSNNFAEPFIPVVGAAADPNAPTTTPTAQPGKPTSTSAANTNTATDKPGPNTANTSSTSATSTGTGTSSTSAKTSSTSTSTSSTSTTSTSATLNLTGAPTDTPAAPTARPTVTKLETAAPDPSATAASNTTATTVKKASLTAVIVIAASVGGAAIIWTIIRKWKFKPSSQFEDRMQPIDWQPTGVDGAADGGIPGNARRHSGASSFRSGGHGDVGGVGVGAGGAPQMGYAGTGDYGHGAYGAAAPSLGPLPDHDFTAPAQRSNLAPVGGYADLNRGPSPGPQMADLSQGPMYHPQYEQYAMGGQVPLHHQPGFGAAPNDAYDYNGNAVRY